MNANNGEAAALRNYLENLPQDKKVEEVLRLQLLLLAKVKQIEEAARNPDQNGSQQGPASDLDLTDME